jgi:putative mRNA 3-end processing factor
MSDPLLQPRPEGLYCPAGDFFIDPMLPVARAVVTHAHGDHARPGSRRYQVASAGIGLMRERLGHEALIDAHAYGVPFKMGDVEVSLHPAGHVLGSAQVRMAYDGRVVVVSGDYKRDPDPTCIAFEPVPCDVFVTESTFGLPVYRWPPMDQVIDELLAWWDDCARRDVPAVLFCYALGKAQRILAELALRVDRVVHLHGAMLRLVESYREAGVRMVPTEPVSESARGRDFAGELIMAPPSAAGSPWMKRFNKASTGFASGWMQIRGNRRRRGYDRGFVVSDHADWPGLIRSIEQSRASRIYVTHGDGETLIRHLRDLGHDAQSLRDLGDGAQGMHASRGSDNESGG